jgi:osomolarity two-component system sensor histidine kinase NIK1
LRQFGEINLGSAICKGLVDLMQGEICVASKVGEGSSFHFTCVLGKADKEKSPVESFSTGQKIVLTYFMEHDTFKYRL